MVNKSIKNIIRTALISSVIFTPIAAQAASATANATARVITPISITKDADLVFGDLTVGGSGGTLVMSPAGSRSTTGDVTAVPSTFNAASYTVSGQASKTYSISLPASTTIISGGDSMTVDTFTSNPNTTGALDGTGNQTLNVGATLNVDPNQNTGTYSGTYDVTVEYN